MKYQVTFAPEAEDDYHSLRAFDRGKVRDAVNTHLLHQPARLSKTRIKRLRDMRKTQYRLRVGDIRVFYDVEGSEVEVLRIVDKKRVVEFLERPGEKS